MLQELKALLARYKLTYFRYPGKPFRDFLVAFIMGGLIFIRKLSLLGVLSAYLFIGLTPITYLMTARSMLGEIVEEKSTGIKEYLKLNGLGTFTYQLYFALVTSAKTLAFSLIILIGYLVGYLIPSSEDWSSEWLKIDVFSVIGLYILGALATASFILFLSVFFSDPKIASSIGGLIYSVFSVISLLALTTDNNRVGAFIFGLFPQAALNRGIYSLLWRENRIQPGYCMQILLFDLVLYSVLFIYLDQVIGNEHGVSKSFFFCCQRKKQRKIAVTETSDMGLSTHLINQDNVEGSTHEEDWSSAVFHEELAGAHNLKKTVQIKHLIKKFNKTLTAVDDISFSIYAGQIFCLLGHNGAGKTTTIKMLTGLLEIDSGDVTYDGEDFLSNMEEARKKIGICTQNDILFEKLTVREHLELIAKLRGIPFFDIQEAVDKAINSLNLGGESRKYSEELSGGNKRKLSLAMAILGQTKVIFLDEPTSGMDPQTRRIMWETLRHLKEQGLTILLTTHHLDEADELADRVAIMSKGRLLAMGTCEYFKKNFGVGYHLNITPVYEKLDIEGFCAQKEELRSLISETIPLAQFDEQTAKDVLKCSLPFVAQRDFPKLFTELETKENLRVSVEMNTLEDVYVNIGLSEDRLLSERSLANNNTGININTQPPECLKEPVVYSFSTQMLAIARRRVLLLTRSKKNMLLVLLPFLMILICFAFNLMVVVQSRSDAATGLAIFVIVCFFAFTLNTGAYCSLPVYEREEKLKYLMDVMGLRNLAYWVGNLLVDFIILTVINIAITGCYTTLYYRFFLEEVSLGAPSPWVVLMFLIPHGLGLITMGYMFNFLLTKEKSAQGVNGLFDKSLSAIKFFPMIYSFGLCLFSSYTLYGVILNLAREQENYIYLEIIVLVVSIFCPSTLLAYAFIAQITPEFGSFLNASICSVVLLVYGLLYFWITVALESRRLSKPKKERTSGWSAPETQAIPVDQGDVDAEKNRTTAAEQDPIRMMNLSKIYENGYAAVKGTTFGVSSGQIFGLLGPNGAGKSTSFNILTAATAKSAGSAQLLGQEINRNMPEVFENVGICPQFNPLWDVLTVKEHLELFGKLKGLKNQNLSQVVNYYLDVLQLRDHANKKSCELSGGNKRKLCVANAFIGSASLLFLDEPSTGVDPVARRFLWNSIQQVLKMRQASVVLTTHSMYEAESLSHKIGILINGRFVCIGPTQYLKDKYSQGYKITVSLRPEGGDPMPKIMEIFPNATRLQESSHINQTYHIPFEGFKFSKAFEKLDALKHEGGIKDFSLYNTTLEQIFIYFSRFQMNNPGAGTTSN